MTIGGNASYRMRAILRTAAALGVLFAGWGGGFVPQARAQGDALPFAIKVTKEPADDAPAYMGRVGGMDFPFCGVKIDGEYWILLGNAGGGPSRWKGTNFVNAVKQPDGRNENRKHVERPYMLGGMWYDETEKKLYAPMHCETHKRETGGHGPNPMDRQIHLASSTDKGATWKYEGPIMTRDAPQAPWRTVHDFSGAHWDGGDGDFYLYVDTRGGHLYLYTNHYTWPKRGTSAPSFLRHHVARCAIGDKMAPGKWKKFYNGAWDEPGLGGKSSYVNGYYVMYNTFVNKYLSFNYGSGISLCSDLTKQDWTPSFEIQPKEAWGTSWSIKTPMGFGWGGWHVMNADKTDIYTGGRTLYFYKYWMGHKPECYRLDLGPGQTRGDLGYHALGGYAYTPTTFSGPFILYGDNPFYESADPIEGRRTRKVERGSAEVTASQGWDKDRVSGATNSSLELAFKGSGIYWRAARGPNMGKADVYLDGVLQATVDTWASVPTRDMFAFVKTGLDPARPHTIKVVVRGEKNPRSGGTAIAHLCFEYSAESYRASHGFSGIQGKNQWRYQSRQDDKVVDLTFQNGAWAGADGAGVGFDSLRPAAGPAVRAWVAPHDGMVRIEGQVAPPDGVTASLLHNGRAIWPAAAVAAEKVLSHDLKVVVKEGDSLSFMAQRNGDKQPDAAKAVVSWDPTITYTERGEMSK